MNLSKESSSFYIRTDKGGKNDKNYYYSPLFSAGDAIKGFSEEFTTVKPEV